jgi:PAS domain S-box-containing protein
MKGGGLPGDRCMKKGTRPEKTKDTRDELSTLRRRVAEMEESIKGYKERYEWLYEECVDGYASINMKGFIRECNSSFKEMVGYSGEELKRMTYRDLTPPLWRAMEEKILREQVRAGCYSRVFEKEFQRKDGTVFPAMLRTYLLKDRNGKYNGIWAFIRDITDGKRAEEAVKETRQLFFDIIDFLPDATFAIDRRGIVIAWNKAMEEMTGFKAERMLGKGNHEYAIPIYGKRMPVLIDLVLNPGRKKRPTYDLLHQDQESLLIAEAWVVLRGKKVYLWGKASPLYDSKGEVVGAIESLRDITDRKRYEDSIRKREAELEAKTRELEEMNSALRVLLKQRENDRKGFEEDILANIKTIVFPRIEKLKAQLPAGKSPGYIHLLEADLRKIVSPFVRTLSTAYSSLTNREIQIANLIREDKSTKEIANLLNISECAVNGNRCRIRRKLKMSRHHNFRVFLTGLD